jgi:hypothetical protein
MSRQTLLTFLLLTTFNLSAHADILIGNYGSEPAAAGTNGRPLAQSAGRARDRGLLARHDRSRQRGVARPAHSCRGCTVITRAMKA